MSDVVLVVAVHPDDETLGCGGTLLRLKEEGAEIHWVIVTSMTNENGFSIRDIELRDSEISAVAEMYAFSGVYKLGFPAAGLDKVPISELVAAMSSVFHQVKPNQVFLPFHNDVHSDHKFAFTAAYSCTKTFRYPSVKKIMMVEALSETDYAQSASGGFIPNQFVDITNHLDKKMQIMRLYRSELKPHPFPRSEEAIRALAIVRGAAAGCQFAESFVLLKEII